MSIKSNDQRWGGLAQALHWLSALLIIGMICIGISMVNFITDAGMRFDLYQMHKAFGFVVFAVIALRIIWRFFDAHPAAPESDGTALQFAAKALHFFFYLAILTMIVTGWMMVSKSIIPIPISFFGLFDIPALGAPDAALEIKFKALHHVLGWFLTATILVHIVAALKHHWIDKDNVLRRMLPFR